MFIEPIRKKVNHMVIALIIGGFFLLFLGVLIVWSDFMVKLVLGVFVLAVSYFFFYGAHKLHSIKKDIEKIIKF